MAKLGHEPHNRRLADDPDEFRDHMPGVCGQCGGAFALDAQKELIGEYDEIEIPPVKPYVIRHRRFAFRCAHCGVEAKAPAPAVATTTPVGPRIRALAIYLKGFQALSYERLGGLFRDAFGLEVSEGALMNMFIRSHHRSILIERCTKIASEPVLQANLQLSLPSPSLRKGGPHDRVSSPRRGRSILMTSAPRWPRV